jgi:uncharacterized membrane protein YeaQ/YmgE (transglycosylase-associated protein family)
MSIIMTILIGFIVGLFARAIMPGKDALGFILTTLLGIGGAFLGTFLGQAIGHYGPHDSAGFLMSLLGALVLLYIYHIINKSRSNPPA